MVNTTVFDILEIWSPGKHVVTYRSSAFHSASGPVLIPTWGHVGQNKARSPSPVLSGQSWATPTQILLCRSLHCRDIRRSSWYWSYMLLWVGMDMAKYWNTHGTSSGNASLLIWAILLIKFIAAVLHSRASRRKWSRTSNVNAIAGHWKLAGKSLAWRSCT